MLNFLLLHWFLVRSGCLEQILRTSSFGGERSGQIQSPRLDSHLSSGCLDDLHNLEEQFSLDSEEVTPITSEEVGEDLHIERTCTEAEESNTNRVALDPGMLLQ